MLVVDWVRSKYMAIIFNSSITSQQSGDIDHP